MTLTNQSNLLPFDLEKFKDGHTAITRNGQKVQFIAFDSSLQENQQLIYKWNNTAYGTSKSGIYSTKYQNDYDLIGLLPKTRKLYLNIYPDNGISLYLTLNDANKYALKERNPIIAYEVEIPDNRILD